MSVLLTQRQQGGLVVPHEDLGHAHGEDGRQRGHQHMRHLGDEGRERGQASLSVPAIASSASATTSARSGSSRSWRGKKGRQAATKRK